MWRLPRGADPWQRAGTAPPPPPVPVTRAGSDRRPGGSALQAPGRRAWNHLLGETGREKLPPSAPPAAPRRETPVHGGTVASPSAQPLPQGTGTSRGSEETPSRTFQPGNSSPAARPDAQPPPFAPEVFWLRVGRKNPAVPRQAAPEGDALGVFLVGVFVLVFWFFFLPANPKLPTCFSPNPALLGNN